MKKIFNHKNRKIFKIFILSHILAYTSLLVIPARAKEPNIEFLFLINSLFLILVVVSSLILYLSYPKSYLQDISNIKAMSQEQLYFNIKITSYGSVIGFLLMLYDRVFIRGIDYTKGLRLARYTWLHSTGGSYPSIIGNLLVPLGYLCIFFFIVHQNTIHKKYKRLLLISAITSIVGHAALNGGRSNLLIAAVFALISYTLKYQVKGKKLILINPKIVKLLPIVSIGFVYVALITFSSASMGNVDMKTLSYLGIESLYGQVTDWFGKVDIIGELAYLIIYFIAYLYHGQWTAQFAYSLTTREGNYTFYSISIILERLGIINEPFKQGYFSETGAFISLPGAFYYDFGYFGLIISSIIVGLLFAVALIFINRNKFISGTKLGYIYFMLFLVFMSPILPAYGLMYLNFIIFSFIAIDILNYLKFKQKSNWLKEVIAN